MATSKRSDRTRPPASHESQDVTVGTAPHAGRIALALVTRNRPATLERCALPSLRAAASAGIEVVLVDQSVDGVTERLVGDIKGLRYLRSDPPLSRGRNLAVAHTSAPLIAFTDDDVIAPSNWLEEAEGRLAVLSDAGALCGRAREPGGRHLGHAAPGVYSWPQSAFGLGSGFNLTLRRAALEDAGPFDELLGPGARFRGCDDTDMLYRILRAGWQVACSDDIDVIHSDWRKRGEQPRLHFGYGYGAGAQTAKHLAEGDAVAGIVARKEVRRSLRAVARHALERRPGPAALRLAFLGGLTRGYLEYRRTVDRAARRHEPSPTTIPSR